MGAKQFVRLGSTAVGLWLNAIPNLAHDPTSLLVNMVLASYRIVHAAIRRVHETIIPADEGR